MWYVEVLHTVLKWIVPKNEHAVRNPQKLRRKSQTDKEETLGGRPVCWNPQEEESPIIQVVSKGNITDRSSKVELWNVSVNF